MAKKVAIILSGCGVFDGSEIYESVLTVLALDKAGAQVECFAPDMPMTNVINHHTHEFMSNEKRNVLSEAGRLARGKIADIKIAEVASFDAAIFPGGFGVANNLSNFSEKGENCEVQKDVLAFGKAMARAKKPMGFICIAPTLIPHIYGTKVKLTIGNDAGTAAKIRAMGGEPIEASVNDIVVDEQHKVVSTPAYMLGKSISEVAVGIEKLVNKVLELA